MVNVSASNDCCYIHINSSSFGLFGSFDLLKLVNLEQLVIFIECILDIFSHKYFVLSYVCFLL